MVPLDQQNDAAAARRSVRVAVTHNHEDLEAYYGRALPELEGVADVVLNDLGRELTTGDLVTLAADADVIVAHRSTSAPAELFESLPRLKAFLRTAVDISTIDVDAASAHGVLVARADKSFVASTAELALGLLLDAIRHIADSAHDYRSGVEPPQRPGRQLRGQTAGIIGFGSIGSYLSDLLAAIGVDVLVHDPFVDVSASHVTAVDLAELLARSDVVFPLAPAEPATENLIGASELAAMRPGSVLVNVSRGELVDEDAVLTSLQSGHLGALAMDVGRAADQRPSPSLAAHPRVVATPHLGGLTPENADAQSASSVEQVTAIVAGEMPPRAVNPDDAHRLRAWWADR